MIPYLLLFSLALLLRLFHYSAIFEYPIYHYPFGGHQPYFEFALQIYNGNLNPWGGAITLNSPGYSYLVATVYRIFGVENFIALRVSSLFLDAISALLLTRLASKLFSPKIGLLAGLLYATSGTMIFFASSLTEIPFTIFLLLIAFNSLFQVGIKNFSMFGACFGLATLFRPDLITMFCLLLIGYYFQNKSLRNCSIILTIFLLLISPLSILNYINTRSFIPLTASSGHNFFIGHNLDADVGYNLPRYLDGDIFLNMKKNAETSLGSTLSPREVSSFYTRQALEYIISNPSKEILLFLKRIKAFISNYEATTYEDFYFQQEKSGVLTLAIGAGVLFSFAFLGCFHLRFQQSLILIPIIAAGINISLFFFLSRLRAPAMPFVIVLAAVGLSTLFVSIRDRKYNFLIRQVLILVCILLVTHIYLPSHDSSNEYNKLGIAYQALGKIDLAEESFQEAIRQNPDSPDSYQNLNRLQEKH